MAEKLRARTPAKCCGAHNSFSTGDGMTKKIVVVFALLITAWSQSKTARTEAQNSAAMPTEVAVGVPSVPMNSIDPARIGAHVKFLASDLLEGRGTGQRGGDIAAEYIAAQFQLLGLKPSGDNGGFLQKVPLVGVTTDPEQSTF